MRKALLDLMTVSDLLAAEEKMVLEDGGSGWGSGCLASRHCGILLECKFGVEEVGAAGLLKS